MTKVYNLAIFPAGSEIAFEINNALKYSKFVNIFGLSSVSDHSAFVYKNYYSKLPYMNDEKFIIEINKYIKKNKIDYIYPAMDMVQVFLTNHQEEINAIIITSDKETVNICRSKERTYEHLKGESFVPKTYSRIKDIDKYPVFVKPKEGQGSQGAKKIINEQELKNYIEEYDEDLIICEYLSGVEYTVDCFTDRNGKLLISNIRSRDRIRTGISVRSTKQRLTKEVKNIAKTINKYFKFNGAWFFQLKKNDVGEYKLMEISPRIPGTMGLSRNLGINFPLLTLFNEWGFDLNIINNDYQIMLDRAFINRYNINVKYDNVYIDFDDTITNKGKLNLDAIRYLYQLVNENKNIFLLTRHGKDINETLKKYKLSKDLFTEIIKIKEDDLKSNYIKKEKSIFIDDSYRERFEVHSKLKIPVFDVDMIESLLDWRL